MKDLRDFDRYCDEHDIKPGEEPAAFAAWMNEKTGWDGPMKEYHGEPTNPQTSEHPDQPEHRPETP